MRLQACAALKTRHDVVANVIQVGGAVFRLQVNTSFVHSDSA
jgi:hypothetical protein